MKTFLTLASAVFALASILAADTSTETKTPPLCGGYSRAEIDSGVKAAAAFAVREQSKSVGRPLRLVEILKAEQQVVAGLNYRFHLKVEEAGKTFSAQAIVWRKLDGSDVLTSWVWSVR